MSETNEKNVAVLTAVDSAAAGELDASPSGSAPEESGRRRPGTVRPMPPRQVRDLLVAAVWIALVTGLVESGYWAVKRFALGQLIFMNSAVFWLAPLVCLMAFIVPAAVAVLAARVVRHPTMLPFGVTLLSVAAWLNTLLLIKGLHPLAHGILACGLAAVSGYVFERRAERALRLMRRSLGWLVACILLIPIAQQFGGESDEGPAPPAAHRDAPNVLLIVLDTVRADALGLYGGGSNASPRIDRFARQGVVFEQAASTAPWTLPSTAGMFTGRLPYEISADWMSSLDDRFPVLAGRLRRKGYSTAGFVANTRYCSAETGLARGFDHYEDYRLSWADFAIATALTRRCLMDTRLVRWGLYDYPARISADEINDRFLTWLDSAKETALRSDTGKRKRPFFAFLNYWDAHDPYVAPPPFDDHRPRTDYRKMMVRYWWWMRKEGLSRDDVDFARAAYGDCIRYLDSRVGRLLDELERRDVLENTLVIITADHGEHFGEHGLLLHGNSLYEPLLHVPLVLVYPKEIPQGRRIAEPVSLRDLPETVLELAGLSDQRESFPGRPLSRYWRRSRGETYWDRNPVFAEIATQAGFPPCHGRSPIARGPMASVRAGRFKYIRSGDGEELFDLEADPRERKNLVEDETHRLTLQELRETLSAFAPVPGS